MGSAAKNINKTADDFKIPVRLVEINNPERKIKKRKVFSFLDEEE